MGRKQAVRSCGFISYEFIPMSGVPQGSNLESILFTLFVNDLSNYLPFCEVLLFADDVKLYVTVTEERHALLLQREVQKLHLWSVRNGLQINLNKCRVISFYHGLQKISAHYFIAETELDRVDQLRDLGVIMDSSLSFKEQLKVVVNKCLKIFGFIRNVTLDFKNASTIIYLYKTLILPIMTYCISIWCPKTENRLKDLIAIEHKVLRYASTKTSQPMHFFNHDYTEIRAQLKVMSLKQIIKKIDYLVAFKIAKKAYNSKEVNDLFTQRLVTYNLRHIREIESQSVLENYISNSTTFRLQQMWNCLPSEVRSNGELSKFKTSLERFLTRNDQ